MNSWKIAYTEHAENDLRDIYEYIAYALLEPEIAKKQTRRIINAISKLSMLPLRYQLCEKEQWHCKGIRVMPIDNYLAFYLPLESQNTVFINRIMYSGRDIDMQLSLTEGEMPII